MSAFHKVTIGGREYEMSAENITCPAYDETTYYRESVKSLEQENLRLRTALQWYANESTYYSPEGVHICEAGMDRGQKARQALSGDGEKLK